MGINSWCPKVRSSKGKKGVLEKTKRCGGVWVSGDGSSLSVEPGQRSTNDGKTAHGGCWWSLMG